MNESEEVHVIGRKCFVCQRKQCRIIVKMLINESGMAVKSQNRMTFCRNKNCHRYQEDLPQGWIYESIETYEREQNKIRDSWKPRRYIRRKPYTKNQSDEATSMDTEGAEIRTVEGVRHELVSRRHTWNGESVANIQEPSNLEKALEDSERFTDGDEHSDILE